MNKGGNVVGADVITLTETLMNELIKLDAIAVDGDVKEQKKIQVPILFGWYTYISVWLFYI